MQVFFDKNICLNINSEGKLYISNSNWGIFISSDIDTNWMYRPAIDVPTIFATIKKESDEVYISNREYGLFKLTYGGIYYEYLTDKFNKPNLRFEIIKATDKSELVGYSKVSTEPRGIYFSTDDTTWNLIKNIDSTTEINVIEPYKNFILLGTSSGLEYTSNSGSSWNSIELPNIPGNDKSISSISISDSGHIYAVYGNYYLIKGMLPYTNVEELNPNENGFALSPNQVTDKIIIRFKDEFFNTTELQIFNSYGQEMESLSRKIETNTNQIEINVSSLPDGLYFVVLNANGKITSKPFIVLK